MQEAKILRKRDIISQFFAVKTNMSMPNHAISVCVMVTDRMIATEEGTLCNLLVYELYTGNLQLIQLCLTI
jgi:hypothetical protein